MSALTMNERIPAAGPRGGVAGVRARLPVVTVLLAMLMTLMADSASSAPAGHSTNPVFTIPTADDPSRVVGSSTLVRTDNGVSLRVETSALQPRDVATLWVIVANDPDDCEAGFPGLSACGPGDHIAGRGQMSVHYGAGRIVAEDGTAHYGTQLRVGDTSEALFEGEPGLLDPRGAEVFAVIKTHGPKIPGLTSQQLHTFAGGCADQRTPPGVTPRPGMLGEPGSNDCAELQFSVHSTQ